MFTVLVDKPKIFFAISACMRSSPRIVVSLKTMLSQPYNIEGRATWFQDARAASTLSGPDFPMWRHANLYFFATFKHLDCLEIVVREMEAEVSSPR